MICPGCGINLPLANLTRCDRCTEAEIECLARSLDLLPGYLSLEGLSVVRHGPTPALPKPQGEN